MVDSFLTIKHMNIRCLQIYPKIEEKRRASDFPSG